ncbi:MAG: peptidylprolyl isomerase [Planctomycetes bacterium]|nr:peptidylprolyl isomerase [Planctomycetota bacterium]
MARHWLIHSSLVVVVALVCLTVGFQAGAQETPDKGRPNSLKVGQVQKVGGKIITAEDLIARIWEYESMLKPDQRVLEPTMSYLRDTALLDLESERLGLVITEAELDAETDRQLKAIKAKVKSDTRGTMTYEQWLTQQGLNKDDFETYVHDRSKIILQKRILVNYFEKTEPSISSKHILVKTREQANDIIKILKATPADKLDSVFEDLAVQRSIDPAAGITRGKLPRLFEHDDTLVHEAADALWKLKDGEFTKEAVKTDYGYHVFKRDQTFKPKKRSLEEMREELIAAPTRTNEEEYFNRWARWVFNTQHYKVERRLPGFDCKPNELIQEK